MGLRSLALTVGAEIAALYPDGSRVEQEVGLALPGGEPGA